MSAPTSPALRPLARKAPLGASLLALMRLSVARTFTPMLSAAMAALLLLPLLFALAWRANIPSDADIAQLLATRLDQLILALATPLTALLLGTSALSAEAEDGTLLYLVTTTTPRWWIAASRVLFASTLAALLSAASVAATGFITSPSEDPANVIRAFVVAAAFGGATYAALFTALALLVRRSLITGLVYVLFWEGILSQTFPALHYLSVRQWSLAIAKRLTDAFDTSEAAGPSVRAALIGATAALLLAVVIGGRKLNTPRITRIGT
ncbi:MAG: ABC transporter permease subunit [Gemmatimonadota bacterium]